MEKANSNTVLRKAAAELKLEWSFMLWEERPLQVRGQQRHNERSRRGREGALKVLPESPGDGRRRKHMVQGQALASSLNLVSRKELAKLCELGSDVIKA